MRILAPPRAETRPPLTDSARAVLRALAASGPATRPRLGALLELSKPTMSAAVAELTALGLVASRGVAQGATGRKAVVYGLGPAAGHVIGIDAGSTRARALARSLDGRTLAEAEEELPRRQRRVSAEMAAAAGEVAGRLTRAVGEACGPLRAVAVALPAIVSPAPPPAGRDGVGTFLARFRAPPEVPLLIENNVNCAAIAELHHGAARGRASFAYLQVGVKIGLGIVAGGRLFTGAGGAAGEVGRLPFPWSEDQAPRREGLEDHLGSEGLVRRCGRDWPAEEGAPPRTAAELFARAAAGSGHARRCVERHAADIGRLVTACVGILDPGLVVLGGGVGQNPVLVEGVRRVVDELAWPTEIATSLLGSEGTVLGAVRLAAEHGIRLVLEADRHAVPPPRPAGAGVTDIAPEGMAEAASHSA